MKVFYVQIPVGKARDEGRVPNHDGEFLGLYWHGDEWIVENNAGVVGTHIHDYVTGVRDNHFHNEDEYVNAISEAEEIQAEIDEAVANHYGELATNGFSTGPLGGEARKIARQLGWPINDYGGYEEDSDG
jgi:hypothetical protein